MRMVPWVLTLLACAGNQLPGTTPGGGLPTTAVGDSGDGGGGGHGGGGDTTADRYHPLDYAEAAVHGPPANVLGEDCTTCHGQDFSGGTSGVSCDSCHLPDWDTNCTYCHGGVEDTTGAPPRNIDGTSGPLASFDSHSAHVDGDEHPSFACSECHVEPTDVFTPGHVYVGETSPGVAEVTIAGSTWSNGSCSNLYCHGDGQTNGTADNAFVSTCNACHPDWTSSDSEIDGMSGEHGRHVVGEGYDCSDCHGAVMNASHVIVDPSQHVDRAVNVDGMLTTWNASAKTCDGDCHGGGHSDESW